MHHIYHTEGIILSSKNSGEAGRYYAIFTRDLGLIYASAQGIRKVTSKLRFVLQDFNYLKIDLVQGKDFWRITSAQKTNVLEDITKNKETLMVFANIARLLKRLLPGVEPNQALFEDLLNGLLILEKATTREELRNIEIILVLRMVNNLGYIGEHDVLENFIKSPLESEIIFQATKDRKIIISEINKALRETQL